jgi:hypothetical protein
MQDTSKIKPHMPVVCSMNKQFGMVDHIEGNQLKLTKDAQGKHHFIPLDWVTTVDDKVHVNKPGDEVMQKWTTSPGGDAE